MSRPVEWHWLEDPLPPPRCSCGAVAAVWDATDPDIAWCARCAAAESADVREAMRQKWPF
jgi:hypothetical protein